MERLQVEETGTESGSLQAGRLGMTCASDSINRVLELLKGF